MKRNITVNIFGSLYPMDEDAYAMLNAYISNMRDYFSRQPDGKEIADDIEGRVAELMSELRQNGVEAISIEHIEEIINRVGKPEQFVEEEAEATEPMTSPSNPTASKKKLFRDPEHKFLGGVFAGLGCYLGINPLWLRLAYILLIFGFFVNMPETIPFILLLIASYFVCWGSIPVAANPAERLQMKGEQVNLSNMCEEFLTSTREMLSRQSQINKNGRLTAGFVSVLRWCVYSVGCLFIATCIIGMIGLLIATVCAVAAPWSNLRGTIDENFPVFIILDSNPSWVIWIAAVSIILLLTSTVYLLAHFTLRILGRIRPLSITLRVICLVVWLIALVFSAASITKIASNINIYHHNQYYLKNRQSDEEKIASKKEAQEAQLHEAGWIITKKNNINKYSNKGQHYSGNQDKTYLEAEMLHAGLNMEYETERQIKVAPGTYRLEVKGRTNGEGAEIYAIDGHGARRSADIPVCGNKGGNVWKDACITLEADTAKLLPNRHYLKQLSKANHSEGYGWSEIVIKDIYVGPDSVIRYGVSNLSDHKTWDGTWLSATSFELIRQAQ